MDTDNQRYISGTTRGHRLPVLLVLSVLAMLTAVAIGAASVADEAQAATPTNATIEATDLFAGPSDRTSEAFAVCPGNKRALGGGVIQSGSADWLYVHASGPLDATGITLNTDDRDVAKQWYAAVLNRDSDRPRDLKVFAVCSSASNATIEETTFAIGHGKTGEAFARCPGTKRAIGGGVVQSGSAVGLLVQASGPLDATGITAETKDGDIAKQWYAAVENISGTERVLKVFAICSGASNATIEATPFAIAEEARRSEAFARCPGTKRALGGGVVQSGSSFGLFVQASGPLDASGITAETKDGDIAKQWYAAVQTDFNERRKFKVFAICE